MITTGLAPASGYSARHYVALYGKAFRSHRRQQTRSATSALRSVRGVLAIMRSICFVFEAGLAASPALAAAIADATVASGLHWACIAITHPGVGRICATQLRLRLC